MTKMDGVLCEWSNHALNGVSIDPEVASDVAVTPDAFDFSKVGQSHHQNFEYLRKMVTSIPLKEGDRWSVVYSGVDGNWAKFLLRWERESKTRLILETENSDLRIKIVLDLRSKSADLSFTFPVSRHSSRAILRSLNLRRLFAGGGELTIQTQESESLLAKLEIGPGALGLDVEAVDLWTQIYTALLVIEENLGIRCPRPTDDELQQILDVATILQTGKLDLGDAKVTFPADPGMARSILKAVDERAGNLSFRPTAPKTVTLFGEIANLGETVFVIENPILASKVHRKQVESLIKKAGQDDIINVEVRSHSHRVTQSFTHWAPPRAPEADLPAVERLADEILIRLISTPLQNQLLEVGGPPAAGKTTLLRKLEERLVSVGWLPVRVALSPASLDAGISALTQIAAALEDQGVAPHKWENLVGLRWDDQLNKLREWLTLAPDRLVLLLDEPSVWCPPMDDSHFQSRTRAIAELCHTVPCKRVVTTAARGGDFQLSPGCEPDAWLEDARNWGTLAASAEKLLELRGDELRRLSPLEIRLQVGVLAATGQPPNCLASRRQLSKQLLQSLTGKWAAVPSMWSKLALIRTPFKHETLTALGGQELTPEARDMVVHCLLSVHQNRLSLHDLLRRDSPKCPDASEVHGLIASAQKETP